jgi:transposase InsO family protein
LSERGASAAVGLQRSVYHYEPRPNADGPIVKLLLELAWQRPEQGFGKLFQRLRRLGHGWNHKRVHRIYCSLKDNGPEMVSVTLADWAEEHNVLLEFIKPGRPMQNGFIERFNRSYREAVLDMFVFQSLSEVRDQTKQWLKKYNEERPHESLGHLTPRNIC